MDGEVKTEVNAEPAVAEDTQTEQAAQNEVKENGGKGEFKEGIVITENEKAYDAALRKLLEIPEGDELGDLETRITEFKEKTAAALNAAKEQVISAELRALQGYDTKLLNRLIDRTKLNVDDSGKVIGIEEAVKAIEAEFPAVVLKEKKPFVPISSGTGTAAKVTMNDLIRGKR